MFLHSIYTLVVNNLSQTTQRRIERVFIIMFWITQFDVKMQPNLQQQISPNLSVLVVHRSTKWVLEPETLEAFEVFSFFF